MDESLLKPSPPLRMKIGPIGPIGQIGLIFVTAHPRPLSLMMVGAAGAW